MFIKRNEKGQITAISTEKISEFSDLKKGERDDVQSFVTSQFLTNSLSQSDAEFIRVLEDLLNVLIAKRVIHFTDLPAAAQNKLLGRESLRIQVKGLSIIDLDDESIPL